MDGGGTTPNILAATAGTVDDVTPSWGQLTILSEDGKYRTEYMHLSQINVSVGDKVKQGDVLGVMGGMGAGDPSAYAIHLHFCVSIDKNGDGNIDTPGAFLDTETIDPVQFYNVESDGFEPTEYPYGDDDRMAAWRAPYTGGSGYRYVSPRFAGGTGGPVEETIWYFLKSKGLSDVVSAAVMGNIEAESSYNPEITESGHECAGVPDGLGHGLIQWTYHTRFQGLIDLATSNGTTWQNINIQLMFLWTEMQGYDELDSAGFYSQTDLTTAAIMFCEIFERPSVPHMDRRINSAQEAFAKFAGK